MFWLYFLKKPVGLTLNVKNKQTKITTISVSHKNAANKSKLTKHKNTPKKKISTNI